MGSLEIKILSAYGLKDQNIVGKMNTYVMVGLSSDPKSVQITEVHTFGGTNPKWKGKPMKFAVKEEDVSNKRNTKLMFKIMAENPLGDREVGVVIILVKDLFEVMQIEESLSCNVSTPSGKSKGMLNFSYTIVKKATRNKNVVCEPNVASSGYAPPPTAALGPGPISYKPGPYPHSPPMPVSHERDLYPHSPDPHPQPDQRGVAAPYPPHHQQPAGYYPPAPQGYPPQQMYAPPPPGAYAYPYAPPPQGPYAYNYPPGYPNPSQSDDQNQTRKVPKKSKNGFLSALGMGAAGLVSTLVLGVDGSSLVDMASAVGGASDYGGMYQSAYSGAGVYNFDLSGHYDAIGNAIG